LPAIVGSAGNFTLAANTPLYVDLRGFIAQQGTSAGMDITMFATLAGNMNVLFRWYEK
jgi:hypothetical protein